MSSPLQRFEKIKKEAARLQRERDRVAGGRQQHLALLKKEFGCDTLEDAETLLLRLTKKLDRATADLEKEITEFERKWPHVLERQAE